MFKKGDIVSDPPGWSLFIVLEIEENCVVLRDIDFPAIEMRVSKDFCKEISEKERKRALERKLLGKKIAGYGAFGDE